jgi:hypothetical protein
MEFLKVGYKPTADKEVKGLDSALQVFAEGVVEFVEHESGSPYDVRLIRQIDKSDRNVYMSERMDAQRCVLHNVPYIVVTNSSALSMELVYNSLAFFDLNLYKGKAMQEEIKNLFSLVRDHIRETGEGFHTLDTLENQAIIQSRYTYKGKVY